MLVVKSARAAVHTLSNTTFFKEEQGEAIDGDPQEVISGY